MQSPDNKSWKAGYKATFIMQLYFIAGMYICPAASLGVSDLRPPKRQNPGPLELGQSIKQRKVQLDSAIGL